MTTIVPAHFDGKQCLVLDEPVDLPMGTPFRVHVEPVRAETAASAANVSPVPRKWQPLNIQIDSELSNAIPLDPEFNIEES